MKIFQAIRKQLAILGVEPTQTSGTYKFNVKLSFGYALWAYGIISCALFIVYSADTATEYIQCFYGISALMEISLCFLALVLQKTLLFTQFENLEKFINKSKNEVYPFKTSSIK